MPLATHHPYNLQLPEFAGPLDLLLRLIEREELAITAISLAAVADQYLVHVRAMPDPDPLTVADFLALAAQLLLIKSRALLPRREPPPTPPEEDIAEQLAQRLREYQQFKQAAAQLRKWESAGLRVWERVALPPQPDLPAPQMAAHKLSALVNALSRRLSLIEHETPPIAIPKAKVITIAEMAELIGERLQRQRYVAFDDLLSLATTRSEVIVALWTVLELVKREIIAVEQDDLFELINLSRGERFGTRLTESIKNEG